MNRVYIDYSFSSERRAKAEMNRSRRKLELEEPDMVEIGKDIMDSEDTDPEDDVPLANLQPVLVSLSQPPPGKVIQGCEPDFDFRPIRA